MIVNLWMSWMSILDKNRKHLDKCKKNKLKNTKDENINYRGPSFSIYLVRGCGLPPVSYATAQILREI